MYLAAATTCTEIIKQKGSQCNNTIFIYKKGGEERMDKKAKTSKLEDVILNFVERVSAEPSTEDEIRILPQMAEVLRKMLSN